MLSIKQLCPLPIVDGRPVTQKVKRKNHGQDPGEICAKENKATPNWANAIKFTRQ